MLSITGINTAVYVFILLITCAISLFSIYCFNEKEVDKAYIIASTGIISLFLMWISFILIINGGD